MQTTKPQVWVAVCTHQRNEPLRRLLESVAVAATQAGDRASVGMVVVDDNPGGTAKVVADEFADTFELGLRYRRTGGGNISVARNAGLDAALDGDWIAMTDDDCVVDASWLVAYLDVVAAQQPDAATGPMHVQLNDDAPEWLRRGGFFERNHFQVAEGEPWHVAFTNNSFVRTEWLRQHPTIRFRPDLGELGGEDMVFFRTCHDAGMQIVYTHRAEVFEEQPNERQTFGFVVRRDYWLGNTEYVTNVTAGDATGRRMALRGARRAARALTRPVRDIAGGSKPQLRHAIAELANAAGMILGFVGVRAKHH